MKAISLFSCGGIGDLALKRVGIDVIVANEIIMERAEVFKFNHPACDMVTGDIWTSGEAILNAAKKRLNGAPLDFIFATPPCQGMSKNGRGKLLSLVRQGLRDAVDPRNLLIVPTVEIFKRSGAHTLIMENVPEMASTVIPDPERHGAVVGIVDYIKRSVGPEFVSSVETVEFADFGVPQCRQRLLSIFTRHVGLKAELRDLGSLLPKPTHCKKGDGRPRWVSVRDVIGNCPRLDSKTGASLKTKNLPFHRVPVLDEDKYFWVSSTPEERGAFDNQCVNPKCGFQGNPTHGTSRDSKGVNRANTHTPLYCVKCGELLPRPWVREGHGYRLMRGYTSAYKRMRWDSPASTLTRNLSYACSDNKLHPSENRVLSLHEAMLLHTVENFEWKRRDGKRVSDKVIRELIGESVPPAGLERIFEHLVALLQGPVGLGSMRPGRG